MNNLKQLRAAAELSLQELADMCGTSKAHLHELEKEPANPTIKTAYAVAKVLGKSVYEIWSDDTEIVEETILIRRVVNKPKQAAPQQENSCLWCKGSGVIKTSPDPNVIGCATCTYCGGTGRSMPDKLEQILKTAKPL